MKYLIRVLAIHLLAIFTFCGGPNVSRSPLEFLLLNFIISDNSSELYSIGGTVSGLSGSGLVLQNNGSDNLTVSQSGSFSFPTKIKSSNTYNVTVSTQPQGDTCTVSNGSGTVSANVTSVTVVCIQTATLNSPPTLAYSGSPFTYTQNLPIAANTPTTTGTISSCTSSPTLPAGLALNNTTCEITGSPTTNQAATDYTITATNAFGSATATINITINNAPPSALTYTGSPYTYTQNLAITTSIPTVTGTITSCSSLPALPTGLTLNNTTCAISGTPTTTQAATSYTISATNAFGTTTASINITVNLAPPSALTYSGSPYTYTQGAAITTNTPTVSGTVTSCSSAPALPTGLTINNTTCAITGTPTVVQGATSYTITAANAFGNTTATINMTVSTGAPSALTYTGSPYTYTQNTAITTNTPTVTGTVTGCSASPGLPTGISINATTCAISGTPTGAQGATAYTITASNAFGNTTASINITVIIPSPSALTYTGSPYTYTQNSAIATNTPTVTGSVTTCTASPALPAGLTINNTTCAISGTPSGTQAATSYTITASNTSGNTTATINITINIAPPSALTYTGSPYTYTQNSVITTNTPSVTGTVTSCTSAPALPAGLSINNTTCAISGTPTGTQAATGYTITASNAFGNTTASINITVNLAPPSALTYTGSPYTYVQNAAIATNTPTVTGTVTSCTSAPALPSGLSINNTTCAISGTPTGVQAATSYTITASNAFGNTTASINFKVNDAPPTALTYAGSPFIFLQSLSILAITPTVTGTVTGCSAAPALPTGLIINNTTCSISGTPTVTQTPTAYTITASNVSGSTTATVNIAVQDVCIFYGGTGTPANCIVGGQVFGTPLALTGNVTTPYGPPQGSWTTGTTNGVGNAARFFSPFGITTDRVNLYVADYDNHQIRKIVIATGAVSLFAGSPTATSGSADGVGTAASFYWPGGITTDGTSLYVTEYFHCLIRKIDIATASVTTIAGGGLVNCISTDGTGTSAYFNDPFGITNDGKNLYIADWTGNKIRKMVLATGQVTTLAGSGVGGFADGTGTSANFNKPFGIIYLAGNLYIGEEGNHSIRQVVISTGAVNTLAGTGTLGLVNGAGNLAKFRLPKGMATDGTFLYVADAGNMVIRKIDIATKVVSTFAGSGVQIDTDGTLGSAAFDQPHGLVSDGVRLYVADTYNNKIRKIE